MRNLTLFMTLLVIFFMMGGYLRKKRYLTRVISSVDNREYLVRPLPDKKEAADILANLSSDLQKLCDHCHNISNNKGAGEKKNYNRAIKRLHNNFKRDRIIEHIPGNRYIAHSVDKGREISICIRDSEDTKFMDRNTMRFVAIHELAHLMTAETGHPPIFWEHMKYLLERANDLSIYQPVDYSASPVVYCGYKIDRSPLFR